ncbi:serine acetyltransferase [Pantoea sp. PNT02]|nr:serine acetyltransferase [Pantoea sp. PNT02]
MIDRNDNHSAYDFMRLCIHTEALGLDRKFTWGRVLRRYWTNRHIRYQVKWRIASYFHAKGGKRNKAFACWLNDRITEKHNVEIHMGAVIGPGLRIGHHIGIVITRYFRAGTNFHVMQNVTIGIKDDKESLIVMGDNVHIGAHTCIISNNMRIGNNVKIGASTFLNKDLPDDVTCYSKRVYTLIDHHTP